MSTRIITTAHQNVLEITQHPQRKARRCHEFLGASPRDRSAVRPSCGDCHCLVLEPCTDGGERVLCQAEKGIDGGEVEDCEVNDGEDDLWEDDEDVAQ
jgi:hypothetical protein